MESENYKTCPYYPQHLVPIERMPYHLVKCEQNYRGPPLEKCKYNATHVLPAGQMEEHYQSCIDYFNANREKNEHLYGIRHNS